MAADGIEIRRMRAHMDKFYSWEVEARKSPIDAVIERLGERLDKCKCRSGFFCFNFKTKAVFFQKL